MPVYVESFDASQAAVAWIGSVGLGLMTGLGAYTGKWADVYGNNVIVLAGGVLMGIGYFLASFSTELWHLYLTQGLLVGVGYSLSFVAGISVVGQWFSRRRGLALGLAVAGSGVGQVALSQATAALITGSGWRATLRYLALINVIGLALCALFIRRLLPLVGQKQQQAGEPPAKPPPSSLRYFREPTFALLYAGLLTAVMGMMMPFVFLPQYALAHGVSYGRAVLLLAIMGGSSVAGRISIGLLADAFGRLLLLQLCMLFGGIATLLWQLCEEFVGMAVFAALYPAFAGGLISLIPAVSADEFRGEDLGAVMGLLYTSTALGNVLSAPLGGLLFEVYGSYGLPISVAGACMVSGSLVIALIHSRRGAGPECSAGAAGDIPLPQSEAEADLEAPGSGPEPGPGSAGGPTALEMDHED